MLEAPQDPNGRHAGSRHAGEETPKEVRCVDEGG